MLFGTYVNNFIYVNNTLLIIPLNKFNNVNQKSITFIENSLRGEAKFNKGNAQFV